MRNKGAILTLAIALALVCIYQLSFTYKAASVRKEAAAYATSPDTKILDPQKEQYFLDSVSSENVFLGIFTYQECIERELNFGLDLKGGMNIILEISVTDVIRNLSSNPKDTTLNRALLNAQLLQASSSKDFVDLFGEEYNRLAPGASLEALFRTKELSERIPFGSTNEAVIAVIKEEANGAIDNAFNIIRARIDQFGVTQPNIQRLEASGRVMVDLPGVKDKDRVRKLLQGTANLEFWQTYENAELQQSLLEANFAVRDYLAAEKALLKQEEVPAAAITDEMTSEPTQAAEQEEGSLLSIVESDTSTTTDTLGGDIEVEYPLFQVLYPSIDQQSGQAYRGSVVGTAHFKDTARVNKYLAIARAKNILPRDLQLLWGAKAITDNDKKPTNYFQLYAIKVTGREGKAPLDGDAITSARQEFDDQRGTAYVSMSMNPEGAKTWARLTAQNIDKSIAIVMDNRVFSAPNVQQEIKGGNSQITGDFTINEATDLANLLKSGKLPAPAHIIEEAVIGPTLGKEAVNAGMLSFLVAFFVVLLYMWFYYSRAGLVADIALIVNVFFIFGVLASLNAALTLPGLAGIILTLGMAVDANVIIYERIKEELRAGKGVRMALTDGYKNAYSAIIDGNVTTIITGIILYIFGTGPIQGFATTLIIGILTSLFSAIFISRLIFEYLLNKQYNLEYSRKSTANVLVNAKINFIGIRKILYVASAVVILIGTVSMFTGGFNLGIDFKGGYNYVVRFDNTQKINTVQLSKDLSSSIGQTVEVKTFGEGNQVKISTKVMALTSDTREADSLIEAKLYQGLIPHLKDGISFDTFSEENLMSSQKVGPTISDDIKKAALWSVIFALIGIFLYIFIRFRDWRFGLGGVISLAHDTLIVLGVYSLLRNVMPFSMEIDQAFIAAILTVIGYSINDTVIIYDRIREYRGLYPKRDQKEVFNLAMNSTLGRTLNTSLTTLFTLIIMFIFGGEVIRGFIFALLIGIGIGTYSSIFNAAPIVFDTLNWKRRSEKKK
ncbi:MAG: protein translocase subunit SecDF [Bacteroidota bacterium]|nr:MAG: protein translocase subunit SecDF [Bacteroidota bacterium]